MELTKSQKKKVRELIEIGIERDYIDAIQRMKKLCDSFIEGKSIPKDFYMEMYSTLIEKDKDIGYKYDKLSASKYFSTLIYILRDGVLTKSDIEHLDKEIKERISFILDMEY